MQLDVTEGEASIKAKADEAAALWGRIDVLVNNAGKFRQISRFYTPSFWLRSQELGF
jgi:NAD(P)-dependent dehydrogenase (short-subunit alcohol dehydrogenase family)